MCALVILRHGGLDYGLPHGARPLGHASPKCKNGHATGRRALQWLARIRNVPASDKRATQFRPACRPVMSALVAQSAGVAVARYPPNPQRILRLTALGPVRAIPEPPDARVEIVRRVNDREQLV